VKEGLEDRDVLPQEKAHCAAIQFTVDQSVLKDAKIANTKAASAIIEKKNRASRVGLLVHCHCHCLPLSESLPKPVPPLLLTSIKQESITPSLTPPPTNSGWRHRYFSGLR